MSDQKMVKIVFNSCYGGFGLSDAAVERYSELSGFDSQGWCDMLGWSCRHDPLLVQVVEELGKAANDTYSDLRIVELPSGTKYRIDEYDGNETVMTPDNYVWTIAE
jgi:hypothetical protein